ncbi:hemicentin-1-like [Ruditapes philippinarum]|uniref:hemicentin-1-like n=1 Tax=Ruditapes philippinarum TaxID=129788 RepID=UPI00295B3EFF|nr:hemicentin-1-like [Ruditapes philippinarum]
MDTIRLKLVLVLLLGLITTISADTVQQIYIKDNKVPMKGGDIQIVCEVSQFTNEVVRVYKTDSMPQDITNATSITGCIPSQCLGGIIPRHTFSPSSSGITINVTNLNRSKDQKYWTCAINNQRQNLYLTVHTSFQYIYGFKQTCFFYRIKQHVYCLLRYYIINFFIPAITPSLQYDNPPSQNQDLVQTSVTFSCSTGCAYPAPNFVWYYNKTGGSRQEWSTTSPLTDRTSGCTDYEKIYTSTLTLPRNTQFIDNTDTTVKFQCGAISITGDQRFTPASVDVRFAVRVSTVTLKDGNSVPSNLLEVNSGEPHTLTCTSSVSRPTATIIWYFGGQKSKTEITRTSSFIFTPEYSDNQKQVYCKAFNIQSESQAVSSNIVSLYVKVKVANVTLKDGNTISSGTLEVTNDVNKTLTCTASESRPTATIIWYIGDDKKKSETVKLSTFTFTPVISDHNKQVYCKASQSGNPDVFSNRITLYVKVLAMTPTITDLTTEKLEGDQIKYQCTSSQTRPIAIVTWKLGNQILTDVQNREQSHDNDLKSVTSIVTFTANRTDNNKTIYCETAIPEQSLVKAQEKMTVYWPPSQPRIMNASFPFLEGQTGKRIYCSSSDYGNPTATATWTTQYGTPDSADTRKLSLPKLTYQVDRSPVNCQLKNLFTQRKGLQIQSIQALLQVEYSPRIQILVDGKQVNTITNDEGQFLSATCYATGNPNPVVNWAVGQQSRGPTLSFDDTDRTDHGEYTCKATATSTHYPSHNFITEEELNVIVNYAPDITVSVSSRNPTENNILTVKCEPKGRPAYYHISSIVHKWGDVVISKVQNPTNGVIEVQNAQLQDSGTYICVANNGIRDRNQKLDQSGNNTVKVKVSPKLLLKIGDRIFAGAPMSTVNITAPFYSDPPPQTLRFKFQNGTLITNSSKHTVSFFKGNVKDTFYGKEVELDGYFAQLQIKNEEESDFINYILVIDNGIGSYKSWILKHVSQSKPSIPKYFNFTGLKDGIPTFRLVGNFNGGLLQTFIIETTEVGKDNWVERLKFNETDTAFLQAKKLTFTFNISGLHPNVYDARVRTGNDIGWINEADALAIQFTITGKEAECDSSCVSTTNIQAIVVGIVLGFINLILLTYAGYVTLLLKRKGGKIQENASCRTVTNVPVYTNIVYSTNESDEQQQTDLDDSGDCQYTSLKNRLQDDKQTYDVLGVVS